MSDTESSPSASLAAWLSSLDGIVAFRGLVDSSAGLVGANTDLNGLSDGIILADILLYTDPTFFAPLSLVSPDQVQGIQWSPRFQLLRRMYALTMRYIEETLAQSTRELTPPDLQLVAQSPADKTNAVSENLVQLTSIILSVVLKSPAKQHVFIENIQSLKGPVKRDLMLCIESITSKLREKDSFEDSSTLLFYDLQREKASLLEEKRALQEAYESLKLETSEPGDTKEQDTEISDISEEKRRSIPSFVLQAELERVRAQLAAAEDSLAQMDDQNAQQAKLILELNKKIDDLTPKAAKVGKLMDELDESRHAVEKYKRMEHVVEKYKKKVEDTADIRRSLKIAKDENIALLERNALLEQEYQALSNAKKSADIQSQKKLEEQKRKADGLVIESRSTALLMAENAELKERISVLEDGIRNSKEPIESRTSSEESDEGLLDAMDNTSVAQLKRQIQELKLERDISTSNQQRDETNKTYREAYLAEREKCIEFQAKWDQLLKTTDNEKDTVDVCVALRMKLDETARELDILTSQNRRLKDELEMLGYNYSQVQTQLSCVGKSDIEAIEILKASVSEDNSKLKSEVSAIKASLKSVRDQNIMRTDEVNSLLKELIAIRNGDTGYTSLRDENRELRERKFELEGLVASMKNDALTLEDLKKENARIFAEMESAKKEFELFEESLCRERTLMLSAWHNINVQRLASNALPPSNVASASTIQTWMMQQRVKHNTRGLGSET